MFRISTQRSSPQMMGSMTLISVTALLISVAEVLGQFCPDSGTVHSTSDQAEGDAPITVRACDIDTDGDPDLITANDGSHTVSVLLNNGDGTYALPSQWTTTTTPFEPLCCEEPVDFECCTEPVDVACCDVNGDTYIDLISVNHTSDDVSVLLNDGSTQFVAPVRYEVGEAPFGIECLNLDGDSDNDLVTNGFTEGAISVLLNNGDGTFAPHVTYAAGDAPIAMALCNVDGDSDDDVVTANMLSKDVSVLRNNGDGTFTNIGSAALCTETNPVECVNPFDIACCDFDGVNGPDVATVNGIADTVTLLFNDGAGGYGGFVSYNNLDGAYAVTCCDLDGDADADVASANLVSDNLGVLLNEGDGSFGAPSFLTVGADSTADPSSVICSNVDNDLDTDLVSTFVDGLTLFENDCGGCTTDKECDDGAFCNGAEWCDLSTNSCRSGTPPECNDGVGCTDDSCNESSDSCDNTANDANCDDGNLCTDDFCDYVLDCQYVPDDTNSCEDDRYCNGAETCSGGVCHAGGDPCPGQSCNEQNDTCGTTPCETPTLLTDVDGNALSGGSRYIEIQPSAGEDPVAFLVTGDPRDPAVSCVAQYAQHRRCWNGEELSETICTSDADCAAEPGYICDNSAELGDTPVYMTPAEWGVVAVRGESIIPYTVYYVQADCSMPPGTALSYPASVKTWLWGETQGPTDDPSDVDFMDISRIVDAFKGYIAPPTLTVEQTDLMGCTPNRNVNFMDISADVDAFKRQPFACPAPCP